MIVCENTPKNPDVVTLANVIMGPSSELGLYALNALRISPNRHCKKLKSVHIMAISFNTHKRYPKIPIWDYFK